MYIDLALINDFEQSFGNMFGLAVENMIENCGIWYSIEDIKMETDDFEMTLEDLCKDYYYIIEDNKIRFCTPDQFWNNVDEYLRSD